MNFHTLDLIVILIYLAGTTLLGVYFGWRRTDSRSFMIARRNLPAWVIGISIFGTYLSSNTFIGIPGKAFSENWNSFVFSLSIPFAAWLAVKYFIPFYRFNGEISAYHHFESRFGKWAKIYAVLCFLFTQFARVGSILFGVSLTLSALIPVDLRIIILITGILVIIYTTFGGMEAVIWTDVVQSFILTAGTLLILILIVLKTPGGLSEIISLGIRYKKFSLGSLNVSFGSPTVWVIFLYGLFINLTNFGMDQNYVQRYHAAGSRQDAGKSVWLLATLYIPVSLLFFFIGTSLFGYTVNSPKFLTLFQDRMANITSGLPGLPREEIISLLNQPGTGDSILPLFISHVVPSGISGLIISAILAAAMSTLSSCMNSSATIYLRDIHPNTPGNPVDEKVSLRILKLSTLVFGIISILIAWAMVGVKSLLDAWWILSGIFSGGLLGLFLLGLLSKAKNPHAQASIFIGIFVIAWMTIPGLIPDHLHWLRSPFHANMIIVIGTLTIFITGILISKIFSTDAGKK